jgi:hypothetical protein
VKLIDLYDVDFPIAEYQMSLNFKIIQAFCAKLTPYVVSKIKSYGYTPEFVIEDFLYFQFINKRKLEYPSLNINSYTTMPIKPLLTFVVSPRGGFCIDVIDNYT